MTGLFTLGWRFVILFLLVGLVGLGGCSTIYDAALGKLGFEKRELLVSRVKGARKAQVKAKEQFSSALDEFLAVTNYQGGEEGRNLEKMYRRVDAEYETSVKRADAVRDRNNSVERTGRALFKEWNREIGEYSDVSMASISREQYRVAERRFEELLASMREAESRLDPVLTKFRDQVLFLKHNLNARAISALEGQVLGVQGDVARLIQDLERSIAEQDKFIREMQGM
ncbi:MAG: DUF2959 family protein [Chthoniobacterales bacterium]